MKVKLILPALAEAESLSWNLVIKTRHLNTMLSALAALPAKVCARPRPEAGQEGMEANNQVLVS